MLCCLLSLIPHYPPPWQHIHVNVVVTNKIHHPFVCTLMQTIGDLSEGSYDSLESDDQPSKPKSSVIKASGNPEMTATKKGTIVDKDHCPRHQSELFHVGNTTSVKLMDDNQMQSELDCNLFVM